MAVLRAVGEKGESLVLLDALILAGENRCVDIEIDLQKLPATRAVEGEDRRRAWMMDSDQLLWRPEQPDTVIGTLRAEMPAAMKLAAPWPTSATSADSTTFSLDATAFRWAGFLAIGDLELLHYAVAGTHVTVAQLPGKTNLRHDELVAWLSESTLASASLVRGVSPYPALTVLVVPIGQSDASVQFGMLRRGGGPSVMLLLSSSATPDSLSGHWVAIHEQLHQLMPLFEGEDAWLSEGFATYYTEIVRARLSLQPPVDEGLDQGSGLPPQTERALARLAAGFGRGRQSVPRETLRSASENLHEWGAYQRVYWQGAAILMELDVELRRRSGGAFSLDVALFKMSTNLDRGRTWSAREWMRLLQLHVDAAELADFDVERWFESRLEQRGMSSVSSIAEALGLDARSLASGKLRLDKAHGAETARVAMRDALFGVTHAER